MHTFRACTSIHYYGCESNWVKSTHDAYENTRKCGELKLYFSPSAGDKKKKKKNYYTTTTITTVLLCYILPPGTLYFFAMLRCLPSAIDDTLDTLYEPNAVFSQFLLIGSASMTFFFFFLFSFPFSFFPFLASSSCPVFSCFSCLSSFLSFFVLFRFLLSSFLSFIFFFLFFVSFLQLTYACRASA